MSFDDPAVANKRVIETNHDKFRNTNAITGMLVGRFIRRTTQRVGLLTSSGDSVLDVGAGEGIMTSLLMERLPGRRISALEYEPEGVEAIRQGSPGVTVTQGSVYELPWPDDSFDVITCFEVLEHLEDSSKALAEMHRVARRHVVLTVPLEPLFRVGNVARGRYVRRLGNTPGHVNHWSPRQLRGVMTRRFAESEVTAIFPWLLATGRCSDGA